MTPARIAWLALALAALAGCDSKWNQAQQIPMASALPSVQRAVGPVPGPGAPPVDEPNPLQGDRQAIWAGRKLFVAFNCVGCHGGRAGGGMGPTLRDVDWIYGKKAGDIFDSIAEGRAHGMPAWGTRIPKQEIWQLVAYIQSLNTPYEPEKPQ